MAQSSFTLLELENRGVARETRRKDDLGEEREDADRGDETWSGRGQEEDGTGGQMANLTPKRVDVNDCGKTRCAGVGSAPPDNQDAGALDPSTPFLHQMNIHHARIL